jgi:hypothetical protein
VTSQDLALCEIATSTNTYLSSAISPFCVFAPFLGHGKQNMTGVIGAFYVNLPNKTFLFKREQQTMPQK